ncbi:MAG: Gldg family protein [Crocinitomicaceae bacterium]|nr:Gldg family protein [Crocinitomicaceae bacterium]MDG1776927.1 Gldg family protein [Crocinitomicaceae bacterium]
MSENKKLIKGLYNWTFLTIVIVAVVLINIISSFIYQRYDITEDQRYSLADGTISYLEQSDNFKSRLNLKIYLEGNLPAEINHFRNAVEDKLQEFKQYTGNKIEYQFINPNVGTEKEQQELFQNIFAEGKGILPMDLVYMKDGSQSQLMLWPGAIIEYGGSTVQSVQLLPGSKTGRPYQLGNMSSIIQNSINNLEYMLISALRRATQETKPRIGFLHGHGELTWPQTQRVRALISPYFNIADITINDSVHALENLDGLIIAQPRKRFSDKDLFLIDQFIMRGGRLMCFLDQLKLNTDTLESTGTAHTTRYSDIRLDRMLFDYGLKINDNYIMDARCLPKQVPLAKQAMIPWFFNVMASPTTHPITRNVEPVNLEYTSEIQFVGNNKNIRLTPILTSSTNSTATGLAPMVNLALPLNYGKNPELVSNPKSEANKKCLAGLAEGTFKSHFRNRISEAYAKNPATKTLESSSKEGKVLLVGNGRFIENEYDSMPNKLGTGYQFRPKQLNNLQFNQELINMKIPHFFGNQDFFQNMTDYMLDDISVLDLRSRQIDIHEINSGKIKLKATFYKVLNIGLPVGIILLLALFFGFIRNKKYTN